MPLPQDIRPVFQDIQDTLIRSDAPWIEQSPLSKVKVLWIGRETGTWASLHHWKKGYAAPPGVLHDATTALEDTTYLFICAGPVLFFDENGFTRYTNWEVMERLRASAEKLPQAAE